MFGHPAATQISQIRIRFSSSFKYPFLATWRLLTSLFQILFFYGVKSIYVFHVFEETNTLIIVMTVGCENYWILFQGDMILRALCSYSEHLLSSFGYPSTTTRTLLTNVMINARKNHRALFGYILMIREPLEFLLMRIHRDTMFSSIVIL